MGVAAEQVHEQARAPFNTGTRVLIARHPYHVWMIVDCTLYPGSTDWHAHYRRDGMVSMGPAAHLIAAPEGYEDAPEPPCGSASYGLDGDDWQAKRQHDGNDPRYVAELAAWRLARIRWAERWLRLVNEPMAEREIAGMRLALVDEDEARAAA
jgi:hypothetical protein